MLLDEGAEYVDGYKLRITFSDKRTAIVDLEQVVHDDRRSVFAALRDVRTFRDFRIGLNTVCWPNGLDLAPEYLYYLAFHDDPDLQAQFAEWGYSSAGALAPV